MKGLLAKVFGRSHEESRGDRAYRVAMREADDIIHHMREASTSTDAARAIMADIWAHNHNIPFLVTVYESVQEMKSGTAIVEAARARKENP